VWTNLSVGVITPGDTTLFLSLYAVFVLIVLVADIYHRAVVLPRMAAAEVAATAAGGSTLDGAVVPTATVNPPNAFMRFVTAFSNYDNFCERDTTMTNTTEAFTDDNPNPDNLMTESGGAVMTQAGIVGPSVSMVDEPIVLHGQHGILHGDGHVPLSSVDSTPAPAHTASNPHALDQNLEVDGADAGGAYALVEDHMDQLCVGVGSTGIQSHNWPGAWHDGKQEVQTAIWALWEDIAFNGDLKTYEKFFLVFEFPFTLLRKVRCFSFGNDKRYVDTNIIRNFNTLFYLRPQATISIPCEGYYNRGFIALSMALSPLWFAFYLLGHEIHMFSKGTIFYFLPYWAVCVIIAAMVLRFAPGGEGNMAMIAATPIALYGFVMAATWIDFIADHLVSLLDFTGIVLRIPGSIMGLTVLYVHVEDFS
jgi:solute carrier family 24 (sodium/potassium/calcium exchanger), member 6